MPYINAKQAAKLSSKWIDYLETRTYKETVEIAKKNSISQSDWSNVKTMNNISTLYSAILDKVDVPIKGHVLHSFLTLKEIFSEEELRKLQPQDISKTNLLPSELEELEEKRGEIKKLQETDYPEAHPGTMAYGRSGLEI